MAAWSANENDDFAMYDERLKVAIDSRDADYIKSKLRPKIDRASVLVCLIGEKTSGSKWVNWEIEYAQNQDKRLVGVKLADNVARPSQVTGVGAIFVSYKKDEIQRAIEWAVTSTKKEKDWVFTN
jgi:hypothetical protein